MFAGERHKREPTTTASIFHGGGGGGGLGGSIGGAIGDAISGGGGGGGGLLLDTVIGVGSAFGSQELAASTAQDFAKVQRRFARRQYGSRYQITMRDLAAAGLNPILAMYPGVAGSPLGATAARAPSPQGAAGVQAASAAGVAKEQRKLLRQQTRESLERTVNTKLRNKELGQLVPVWEENFKANNAANARAILRFNRNREILLDSPNQIKDLINPFTTRKTHTTVERQ